MEDDNSNNSNNRKRKTGKNDDIASPKKSKSSGKRSSQETDDNESDFEPDYTFEDETANIDIRVNKDEDDLDSDVSSDNDFARFGNVESDDDSEIDFNNNALPQGDERSVITPVDFGEQSSKRANAKAAQSGIKIQFDNDLVVSKKGRGRRRHNSCDSQATTIPDFSCQDQVVTPSKPSGGQQPKPSQELVQKLAGYFLGNSTLLKQALESIDQDNADANETIINGLKGINFKSPLSNNLPVNKAVRRSIISPSNTTVYTPAIPIDESSSESSDVDLQGVEMEEDNINELLNNEHSDEKSSANIHDQRVMERNVSDFIAEQRRRTESTLQHDQAQPSTSKGRTGKKSAPVHRDRRGGEQSRNDSEQIDEAARVARSKRAVTEAEKSHAVIYKPGKKDVSLSNTKNRANNTDSESEDEDDEFFEFSAHVEKKSIDKIKRGGFIDLAKLLPKDNPTFEEEDDDDQLQFFTKGGKSFYLPSGNKEKELASINSFRKWDAAFHVYMGIFLRYHPERSLELIQYVDNI